MCAGRAVERQIKKVDEIPDCAGRQKQHLWDINLSYLFYFFVTNKTTDAEFVFHQCWLIFFIAKAQMSWIRWGIEPGFGPRYSRLLQVISDFHGEKNRDGPVASLEKLLWRLILWRAEDLVKRNSGFWVFLETGPTTWLLCYWSSEITLRCWTLMVHYILLWKRSSLLFAEGGLPLLHGWLSFWATWYNL